ncbi:MAG: hypothetical protein CMM60_06470 [Rhodospirillaceae bacterium]|nr:hypothetical protein [Rhodospirillaceae bacterium]
MRNAIIGIVIGVVVGVAVGATVVAPRLNPVGSEVPPGISPKARAIPPAAEKTLPPASRQAERLSEKAVEKPEKNKRHPPFPEQVDVPTTSGALSGAASETPPGAKVSGTGKSAEKTTDAGKTATKKPEKFKTDNPEFLADSETPQAPPAPVYTPPPAGPKTVYLKMASAYASTLPQLGTLAKRLDRDIWRVSDGMLEIKFYEPGALVPPLEMFDAVRAGAIDAAFSTPGFWSNKIPALQLFAAVPFGPSAKEFLAWIYFGGGKEQFEEIYHANGIHSVFCGLIAPEASGWFRKRIRTVEDLKGLKMRFFGLGAKVMQRLGVATTQLASGDIFVAFESGAIDAAEVSMPAIDLKLGLYRMAKNYYFPGWHQPATLFELMINLKKWQSLPVSAKAQIEAVCGDNIRYGLAAGEAGQFQALKKLQAQGVEVRRWPGEVLEALNTAWAEVARDEAKADRDFKRVWDSLSAFRKEYSIWNELSLPY